MKLELTVGLVVDVLVLEELELGLGQVEKAAIDGLEAEGLSFAGAHFEQCTLRGAKLPGSVWNGARLCACDLAGATLGENVQVGLNARYMNFDLNPLRKPRALEGLPPLEEIVRAFAGDSTTTSGLAIAASGYEIVTPVVKVCAGSETAADAAEPHRGLEVYSEG